MLPGALAAPKQNVFYAQVTTPAPDFFGDMLFVIFPDWTVDIPIAIADWPAIHGDTLPSVGADVLLVGDERGNRRCVWWDGTTAVSRSPIANILADAPLNPTWAKYGAKFDGATDDSAALIAVQEDAIAMARTTKRPVEIFVPPGRCVVKTNNVFASFAETAEKGITWQGAGKFASIFQLQSGGSTKWFYDNGATDKNIFPVWKDIGFEGDGTSFSNGFKFTSHGSEQGAQFYNCAFGDITNYVGGTLFDFEGSVGNDSHKLIGCRIAFVYGDVFLWNNPQAVTIELLGTNIELGYGNIFHIGSNGGGDLHVFGGDVLMDGATAAASLTYHLQVDESNNIGQGNGYVHFYGCKFEIRSPTVGLANMPTASNLGSFTAHYHDCAFNVVNGNGLNGTSIGTARTGIVVGNRRAVILDSCQIPAEFTYTLGATSSQAPANGIAGLIVFDKCAFVPGTGGLSDDVSTRFTLTNAWGRATALNCYYTGNPAPSSQRYSLDFDIGFNNPAAGDPPAQRKQAMIFPLSQTWPGNTGVGEKTVILPQGCKITGVYVSKPGTNGAAQAQTLNVGSSDKTITYGTVSGNQNTVLTISQQLSPFQDTGADASDPNQRTVRMWSTGASLNNQANIGGYAIIEYI
jgi:hypothetical protein